MQRGRQQVYCSFKIISQHIWYQNNLYGDKIERSIGSIYILDWKPLIKVELLGCFDARFIPYFTHIFNVLFLFLSVSLSFSVLKKPKVPELVPFISIMCLVSIHPVLFYIFLLDNVFVTFNQFRLLYNFFYHIRHFDDCHIIQRY